MRRQLWQYEGPSSSSPPTPVPQIPRELQVDFCWLLRNTRPGVSLPPSSQIAERIPYRHCHDTWTFALSQSLLPAEVSVLLPRPWERFCMFMCRYAGLSEDRRFPLPWTGLCSVSLTESCLGIDCYIYRVDTLSCWVCPLWLREGLEDTQEASLESRTWGNMFHPKGRIRWMPHGPFMRETLTHVLLP